MISSPVLIHSANPLLSASNRDIYTAPFFPGETIGEYLKRQGVNLDRTPCILMCDDMIIERDQWSSTIPREGQIITVRATVEDSGGGSNPLKLILTIAVALIAPEIAWYFAENFAISTVQFALIEGVVSLAGSLLINALFPPPKPALQNASRGTKESPTYSIHAGSNRARAFDPMPLIFGTHKIFPDLGAQPYTEFKGDDQYLYQVLHFGLSDTVLSNYKIGETALTEFSDYEVEESDMTGVLELFPGNVDSVSGAALTYNTTVTRTTSTDTTEIQLDITGTLFVVDQNGATQTMPAAIEIEYSIAGQNDWQPFSGATAAVNFSNASRKPFRKTFSKKVTKNQYDVRLKKTTQDHSGEVFGTDTFFSELTLSAIKSFQPDDGDYTGQKRIAIKIKASGQLSGVIDRLSAEASAKIPVWNGASWNTTTTSNPAWIYLEIARGKTINNRRVYGAGLADARIDIDAIKEWGVWCENKGLECNLVFDQLITTAEMLQIVARCGRGSPTWASGKLGIVWDEADLPVVQVFGMPNIVKATFKVEYITENLADEIVVNFVNKDKNWSMDQVRAIVPGISSPTNSVEVDIMGVTNKTQAGKEALLMAGRHKYHRRRVSWEADIEGLVCNRGDVVALSHDLTQWSESGRLLSGTSTNLALSKAVSFHATDTPYIQLRFPDGGIEIYEVVQQAGVLTDTIVLVDPIKKSAWQQTSAYSLDDDAEPSAWNGYYYRVQTAGTSGASEPTWPTEKGQTVVDGTVTWVCQGRAPEATPDADTYNRPMDWVWQFAPEPTPGKKVKVISVKPISLRRVEISAIDEESGYYLEEFGAPIYLTGTLPGTILPSITNLEITETLVRSGDGFSVVIHVTWDTVGPYGYAVVRAGFNGEQLTEYGKTNEKRLDIYSHGVTGSLTIEVTVFDPYNRWKSAGQTETTHVIQGKSLAPSDVATIDAQAHETGIQIEWTQVSDIDIDQYILKTGASWATGTEIARIKGSSYLWKMQAAGSYDIMVKAVDTSGNESENEASDTVAIAAPGQPNLSTSYNGQDILLAWSASAGGFPISEYEIREGGSDWETATFVERIDATSYKTKVEWSSKTFRVAAIDAAGNVGTHAMALSTITPPSVSIPTVQVVDNNVLLKWNATPGTLPSTEIELRRGSTFATADVIGKKNGSFTVVFEPFGGQFTYWIAPIDTAGNYGTEQSLTVTVNEPPDYILRQNWVSDFSGTLTNIIEEIDGSLLLPVKTNETWSQHFSNNSWSDIQSQINAGYPIFVEPSAASASYEETFYYGPTTLPSTKITVDQTAAAVHGSVSSSCTISVSDDDISYTDYSGTWEVVASGFRYVKVKIDYTPDGGNNDLLKVSSITVRLDVKLRADSGKSTANSADSGGTSVSFNVSFIDVESINVTPLTTSAVYAVVNFTDAPNPTSFKVLLFDNNGNRVSGDFSWSARGY